MFLPLSLTSSAVPFLELQILWCIVFPFLLIVLQMIRVQATFLPHVEVLYLLIILDIVNLSRVGYQLIARGLASVVVLVFDVLLLQLLSLP